LFGNQYWGLKGLFVGAAVGNVLAGVVITKWISVYTKRLLVAQPLPT
jgi:hypothetical protein